MIRFTMGLLKRLFAKDWERIFTAWAWIYQYVQKYWLQILLYTGLGLVGTGFSLLSSLVTKNLIDTVTGVQTGSIGWTAAVYAGLGLSRTLLTQITGRISMRIRTQVQNEIQSDVFLQVMQTDWESMSDYPTGDLLVRCNGNANAIANSVLSFLPSAVNSLVHFAGAFLIVCREDPWMAVIALIGAPLTFLTSRYQVSKMRKFQQENQEIYSRKMVFDQQTFQNIQTIKAFNLIDSFSDQMKALQQDMLSLSLKQYRYQAIFSVMMTLTGMLVSYASYGFAMFRLWQGAISFGTVTLLVSMASSLSGSFSAVIGLIPTAIQAATSAERIMEIIKLPRESYTGTEKAQRIREQAKENGVFLRGENLSFAYKDGRKVYENGYFEANPGEIVVLTGPSGQGKTTTLRLILGLLRPGEGSLLTGNPGGEEMQISPATRCLFSYVPQGNTMFYGTIAENLRMMRPEATEAEMIEALEQACAWDFVRQLEKGLDTRVGERGHGFSEGQNQRLAIARALLADAPVLLLDEVTSALDLETEEQVLHNIIQHDPNRTVLVVAHRPSVFSMCTRGYRIADGKITPQRRISVGKLQNTGQ